MGRIVPLPLCPIQPAVEIFQYESQISISWWHEIKSKGFPRETGVRTFCFIFFLTKISTEAFYEQLPIKEVSCQENESVDHIKTAVSVKEYLKM